jgi:hypothetical protein
VERGRENRGELAGAEPCLARAAREEDEHGMNSHENGGQILSDLDEIDEIGQQKYGRNIDQHQRHQISGPKPQKTQQIQRFKFELFFGAKFFGKFLGEFGEIGGSNSWQPLL